MKFHGAVLFVCCLASAAAADNIRPIARDADNAVDTPAPQPRPAARQPQMRAVAPQPVRPAARAPRTPRTANQTGPLCNDPFLQGTVIGRVDGAGACGIRSAVSLQSVAGVALQPAATLDCPTAAALKTWITTGARPAVGPEGGGLASLRVVADYVCRNRNNQPGARISEHAFGRAIDIAGLGLRDGTEISVLTGWDTRDDGAQLRRMWQAACGPFGTVLGPDANRFHRDHFHFDTALNRRRPYCR